MRKSGEPFYSHPLEVASLVCLLLAKNRNNHYSYILHDVVEDTQISSYMIEYFWGPNVSTLIKMLTYYGIWL